MTITYIITILYTYYKKMFSKPLRPPLEDNSPPPFDISTLTLSYQEYFKKNILLNKYKLPELKHLLRYYGLAVSGSKPILIAKLEEHYKREQTICKVQKIYRGWLVRYMFRLRGEGFINRKLCVNDSDFITLEPLVEIDENDFFSYKDDKQFIYGFSIASLIQCTLSMPFLTNPYNREQLTNKVVKNIKTLHKITPLVFPDETKLKTNVKTKPYAKYKSPRQRPRIETVRNQLHQTTANMHTFTELFNMATQPYANSPSAIDHRLYMSLYLNRNYILTDESRPRLNRITASRQKSNTQRIQELFMEIDFLGNYTHIAWFSNLLHADYIRYYICISEIWNFRGQLSRDVKDHICPFFNNPLANMLGLHSNSFYDVSTEDIQSVCLTIMENLIYSGVDEEYRKLGALHVLTALTVVSQPARMAMPWLYESIAP